MRANANAAGPTPADKLKGIAAYTWLTTAEAGVLAGGVEAATVRQWIAGGLLAALNISPGKSRPEYRIRPEDLTAFIETQMRVSAA